MTVPNDVKTRENKMRRVAAMRGLMLVKSPRRDPRALDYGLFAVIEPRTNSMLNPSLHGQFPHGWTLEEVEDYFEEPPRAKAKRRARG